ncbi:MAG: aromatic hydrocarbon degradation protein, partial [Dysgonamonadaceae bacterium]
RYGLGDGFQSDLSFSLNSFSLGFGGAVNISKSVQLNIGYFFTNYSDYTKSSDNYNGTGIPGSDIFTRTNKVFAAGVDFSF